MEILMKFKHHHGKKDWIANGAKENERDREELFQRKACKILLK